MPAASAPRVLLGLGPIMRIGMARFLAEAGCEVIAQEERPSAIVGAAHRLAPDLVVLDLDGGSSRELAQLVHGASPEATVVLLAREEDAMEVLDPVSSTSRSVSAPVLQRLRTELEPPVRPRVKE
jgi:DNA-binding NarL/FixJ family response regulator